MKKVFVIHYQPLEAYPPGMNFINFLSAQEDFKIRVSSSCLRKDLDLKPFTVQNIHISRPGLRNKRSLFKLLDYIWYYTATFIQLLLFKPHTVIYFETLSSWPALLYKKIRKDVKLMVHYHEYVSPKQYAQGMKLSRYMHSMEMSMYTSAFSWISQTNEERMEMFRRDNQLLAMPEQLFRIIPNYPPKQWSSYKKVTDCNLSVLRLVFVGSLGYKNMYLQELTDWIQLQSDIELDVYAYNIDQEAVALLKKCDPDKIRFHGGVDYHMLPEILGNYDVGIVMYKPFSENTVHAVSNKVFEYLACGLDVWFSTDMTYSYRYVRDNVYPKVLAVDFSNLDAFDYQSAVNREGLKYQPSQYFYEQEYIKFLEVI
ncbi:MAG TPA: hypothetical protein PLE75_01035 [Ferruginibacter sp.]|nr:hypothetical protein [Ferruginibacter sp.]HRO05239.1 hypothetical protein [Ferruginibacter sp.]HRO96001.1 hypothetical protein [Ferruginibacter sp.]HRP48665.1 hypothetical protein [Ferruginibacter sp.]